MAKLIPDKKKLQNRTLLETKRALTEGSIWQNVTLTNAYVSNKGYDIYKAKPN